MFLKIDRINRANGCQRNTVITYRLQGATYTATNRLQNKLLRVQKDFHSRYIANTGHIPMKTGLSSPNFRFCDSTAPKFAQRTFWLTPPLIITATVQLSRTSTCDRFNKRTFLHQCKPTCRRRSCGFKTTMLARKVYRIPLHLLELCHSRNPVGDENHTSVHCSTEGSLYRLRLYLSCRLFP